MFYTTLRRFRVVLLTLALIIALSAVVYAQDSPLPLPIEPVTAATSDITADFESLPDLAGLGGLAALVVMVLRKFGLPDGKGGYAAFGVGVFIYVATLVLPAAARDTLFDAGQHAVKFLAVILGGQATHVSAKYAGLDALWKGNDG